MTPRSRTFSGRLAIPRPAHNLARAAMSVALAVLIALTAVGGNTDGAHASVADSQAGPAPNCPCRLWSDGMVPDVASASDGQPIEVGVRFRSETNGFITGLRFYKGTDNTGKHTGNLWSADGKNLASTVFTNETASGWQQIYLSAPVRITANTTYIASYHSASGHYAFTSSYFDGSSSFNPPLAALANGFDGANGLFKYGASGFPTETFGSANYWVDVVFETTAVDRVAPTISGQTPAENATGVATDAPITATFSEPVTAPSITAAVTEPGSGTVPVTVSYDAEKRTVTVTPGAPLKEGATYTVSINGAADPAGNRMTEPVTWSFTTVSAAAPPPVAAPDPPRPPERVPLTVTITLDRGPGATYYIGEQMIVCIFVSRAVPVRVIYSGGGADDGGLLLNDVVGGTRCVQKGFSPQSLGGRSVRVEAYEGGEVAASAEVGFTLADVEGMPSGPTGTNK